MGSVIATACSDEIALEAQKIQADASREMGPKLRVTVERIDNISHTGACIKWRVTPE